MRKKISISKKTQFGFATMLATFLVLAAFLIIIGGLSILTFGSQRIAKNIDRSAQAYFAAESGIEDSLYRVIKGKNYKATNSLAVGSSTAAINISGSNSQKKIRANGEDENLFRNLQVLLDINTENISFYYGVQVGEGGLQMANSSKIMGSVYSNGPVSGVNSASITGDIFVAGSLAEIDQQATGQDSDFVFGQSGNEMDAAQSFVPVVNKKLVKVSVYLKKVGLPGDKTLRILTDNNGKPSKNLVSAGAYGTLTASQVSQSAYSWIDVVLVAPPNVSAGTKYWIMIDASADTNNYFVWGKDSSDGYGLGTGKYSPNWDAGSPVWTIVGGDLAFKSWTSAAVNNLDSMTVGGNAHANTILNSDISGDAYYQVISDSTVGGTSYPQSPDPAAEQMPISDAQIADWKAGAQAGGVINGDYIMTHDDTASLGPVKIIGDLSLSNSADLTINGTVYVTGKISFSNTSKLRLGSIYGDTSGVLLSDDEISVGNSATFFGNGNPGVYLLLLSTKSGDAMNLANSASTVIFYASAGNVSISQSADLKEVTAYKITISNTAQINYESGLASMKFSSGSGASWVVSSWEEVP